MAEALQPAMTATSAPRSRVSVGSARSLLLTVLGEFVLPSGQAVWTSALLHALLGVGTAENSARQAIARSAAAGWLEGRKDGRQVRWRLTPAGRRVIEAGSRRVTALSSPRPAWDGHWRVLVVTVPNTQRDSRRKLYRGLSWAGFGNPTAGVWLTPHSERREQVDDLVSGLGLAESTMSFLGKTDSIGLTEAQIVRSGWDLESLEQRYREVAAQFDNPHPAPGDDTLFTHIRVLAELQRLPFSDPQLPEALLPDWIGRRVTSHLQHLRSEWAPEVHARWADLNATSGQPGD